MDPGGGGVLFRKALMRKTVDKFSRSIPVRVRFFGAKDSSGVAACPGCDSVCQKMIMSPACCQSPGHILLVCVLNLT